MLLNKPLCKYQSHLDTFARCEMQSLAWLKIKLLRVTNFNIFLLITSLIVASCNIEIYVCMHFSTDMVAVVSEILKREISINLYMFHGGTNFGFMNGALAVGLPAPKAMVTSYGRCCFYPSGCSSAPCHTPHTAWLCWPPPTRTRLSEA